jgi:tetratricopeptide (TPR) repeat protein
MTWVRGCLLIAAAGLAVHAQPTEEIATAREAVREAIAAHGEEHPVTAFMLRNLALAFEEGGYHNYAEQYARRAIGILESHFGPNDVSLVPALNVLAEGYISKRRYADGRREAMRAVEIGQGAGPHYATALHNVAASYQGEGKLKEAVEFYRKALEARQATLPAGHPYIAVTRSALVRAQRAESLSARR